MANWTDNHVKAIDIGEAVDLGTMEPKYTTNTGVVFRKSGLFRVTVDGNRTMIEEVPEFYSCDGCTHEGKYEYYERHGALYYPCASCTRHGVDYYKKEDEE